MGNNALAMSLIANLQYLTYTTRKKEKEVHILPLEFLKVSHGNTIYEREVVT